MIVVADSSPHAVTKIEQEIQYAQEWIGEHTEEEPERKPRKLGKVAESDNLQSLRSIFDDIDA